jgi:hypothetical protein
MLEGKGGSWSTTRALSRPNSGGVRPRLVAFGLVVASGLVSASGAQAGKPPPAPAPTLATFVTDPSPWLHLEPNSQQRSPITWDHARELASGWRRSTAGSRSSRRR